MGSAWALCLLCVGSARAHFWAREQSAVTASPTSPTRQALPITHVTLPGTLCRHSPSHPSAGGPATCSKGEVSGAGDERRGERAGRRHEHAVGPLTLEPFPPRAEPGWQRHCSPARTCSTQPPHPPTAQRVASCECKSSSRLSWLAAQTRGPQQACVPRHFVWFESLGSRGSIIGARAHMCDASAAMRRCADSCMADILCPGQRKT